MLKNFEDLIKKYPNLRFEIFRVALRHADVIDVYDNNKGIGRFMVDDSVGSNIFDRIDKWLSTVYQTST